MLTWLAIVSAAGWSYLLLARGRYWVSGPVLAALPEPTPARLAVVIPARDEAEHLQATLQSLLTQDFPGQFTLVLVDDNSADGTGALAQELARSDIRLHVVSGTPLPTGWTGKLWAVSEGLATPAAAQADYVLLTDADIVHDAGHLRALIAHAQRGGYGLVSEMVRLRCQTWAERATLPAFVFFFQMLYPFNWVAENGRRTAAAAGGTMLLSREALDRIGGVGSIRSALIDDVALARVVKNAGFRIWLGHGEHVHSNRRYPTLKDVWDMVARTAYVQLRHSPIALFGTCAGMALLYGVPVLAVLRGPRRAHAFGLVAWGLMAAQFQPTLRRCRRSSSWGLALPVIAFFYAGATVASAARFYRGQGGGWKGRTYSAAHWHL